MCTDKPAVNFPGGCGERVEQAFMLFLVVYSRPLLTIVLTLLSPSCLADSPVGHWNTEHIPELIPEIAK